MSAPPYTIAITPTFRKTVARVKRTDPRKYAKIVKTTRLLREIGPHYPSLNSHKYQSLTGPRGEDVWESYVENRTPGAWRLWWHYGPDADTITLVDVGPHP